MLNMYLFKREIAELRDRVILGIYSSEILNQEQLSICYA